MTSFQFPRIILNDQIILLHSLKKSRPIVCVLKINPFTPTWRSERQLPTIHSRRQDVPNFKSAMAIRKDRSEGVLCYYAGRLERVNLFQRHKDVTNVIETRSRLKVWVGIVIVCFSSSVQNWPPFCGPISIKTPLFD